MTVQDLRAVSTLAPEDFLLLLASATKKEAVFLLAHPEYELSEKEMRDVQTLFARRAAHEPVAFILGHKEFYGREFLVAPATLIPRPETELLVEQVLDTVKQDTLPQKHYDIIDVGTGSGNIIITLAAELATSIHHIRFFGIDISSAALITAQKNATAHHFQDDITFIESDLLKKFIVSPKKNTSLIIAANLPYLSEKIYLDTTPDVREYEPASALVSGHDGLDHYRRLLNELASLQSHYESIKFFAEISPEQASFLSEHLRHIFPQAIITVQQDLSGKERLIQATI